MSIPHENPDLRPNSGACDPSKGIACSPYNFVPMQANDRVVKVAESVEDLPDHDQYHNDRYTGWFDVTLTTLSPLYVRCAITTTELKYQEQELGLDGQKVTDFRQQVKNKPDFFYKRTKKVPVIPGSCLTGMLRTIIEIVSYGKFTRVTDKRLFYRDIRANHYQPRMVKPVQPCDHGLDITPPYAPINRSCPCYSTYVRAGYFRRYPDNTYKIEECKLARIEERDIRRLFKGASLYESKKPHQANDPNATPYWFLTVDGQKEQVQHRKIWVQVDQQAENYFFQRQTTKDRFGNTKQRHPPLYLNMHLAKKPRLHEPDFNAPGADSENLQVGTLVLTGRMQFKHLAFVFLEKIGTEPIPVPNDLQETDPNRHLVERFHEDQLTPWQEAAFPADMPKKEDYPLKNGYLRDGDPVFFLTDPQTGELVFFGRAYLFRLPYKNRPVDLIPEELKHETDIDYADALFGYVRSKQADLKAKAGSKERAYAGRVFITEAQLEDEGRTDIWLSKNPEYPAPLIPSILATPKPTAIRHYLTQPTEAYRNSDKLNHYDSGIQSTSLRGYKLYWHQGPQTDEKWMNQIAETEEVKPADTQHTQLMPVRPNVSFIFRIFFENLAAKELGALCWALRPAPETGDNYYHKLGMGKPHGMGSVKLQNILLHLADRKARYEQLFQNGEWHLGLKQNLLSWEEATAAFEADVLEQTCPDHPCHHISELRRIGMLLKMMQWQSSAPFARYMELENEFKKRPVLPDPSYQGYGRFTAHACETACANTTTGTRSSDGDSSYNARLAANTDGDNAPPQMQPVSQSGHRRTGFEVGQEFPAIIFQHPSKGKGVVEIHDGERIVRVAEVKVGDRKVGEEIRVRVSKVKKDSGHICQGGLEVI